VEVLGGGLDGDADLADGPACGWDGRHVGDDQEAVCVDGGGEAVAALTGEEDFEFVACA